METAANTAPTTPARSPTEFILLLTSSPCSGHFGTDRRQQAGIRRFHTTIHGAALVYNLLLARKAGQDALVAKYEAALASWRDELNASAALEGWDRTEWWSTIRQKNPRLSPLIKLFVDRWLDLIAGDVDVRTSGQAHTLIGTRERQIKGGRARLVNQAALDRWTGGSGLTRHEFRWSVARGHLDDLYAARAASSR